MAPEEVVELFATFGPVAVRRMFGGAGIYADDTMFGLIADGVIYLKAGPGNTAAFEREGLEPFTYQARNGKRAVMSYRRMPSRLYDDPEELAAWARAALAAAHAAGARGKACAVRRPSRRSAKPRGWPR